MKKILFLSAFFVASMLSAQTQTATRPFSVPEVKEWKASTGRFAPSGRIVANGGAEVKRVAKMFAKDYAVMFQRQLKVVTGKAKKGDFVLQLASADTVSLGAEGYRLAVGQQTVATAGTPRALYWSTRTLLQLTEQSADRTLACGEAMDKPLYPLRGFMLDCGRKFFPMSYLRDLVKVMAYYKMNTLQIHLNDNGFKQFFGDDWAKTQAAFRLESDFFPGLTAKDGHYTKQEFIALQALADSCGVEIIPEIDVPAHSLAFTHYRPNIASKDYGADHLDIFNPETYTFLDSLFMEYLGGKEPVFRGKRVGIGTDEYSNARQEVVEKFRYFTDRYMRYVEGFGKTPVVWGSLKHAKGTTPVKVDNVWMAQWSADFSDPEEMRKQGYKLISMPDNYLYIVPATGYYYDYLAEEMLYQKWTPAVTNRVSLPEGDPALLGGMFCVWNDHPGNGITVKDVHHRLFPAMQTLSNKCWNGQAVHSTYADFDRQRKQLSEAPAVNVLGRWQQDTATVFRLATLSPNTTLPKEEIGYDYSVNFTIFGAEEAKGTELFRSSHAVFYLSDPQTGRLGFEREGYRTTFRRGIPKGKTVKVTIEGNNKMTRLLIDGQVVETLGALTIYTTNAKDRVQPFVEQQPYELTMATPGGRMYLQRTLVFPLRKTGNFKSRITDFSVRNYLTK